MSRQSKDGNENFLSRWSRRKVEAKIEPDAAKPGDATPAESLQKSSMGAVPAAKMPEAPHPEPGLPSQDQARPELPPIDSLTHDADFTPFMAKDIDPALRNQAMKKLFGDPHYSFDNMDKLDIYIDDYSKSDPIPLDVLKKMYQSKSLFLFDDEEKDAGTPATPPVTPAPASAPANNAEREPDANTHKKVAGNNDAASEPAPNDAPPHRSPAQ